MTNCYNNYGTFIINYDRKLLQITALLLQITAKLLMIVTHCVNFCHELWQFSKLLQITLKSIINYGRYYKLRRNKDL